LRETRTPSKRTVNKQTKLNKTRSILPLPPPFRYQNDRPTLLFRLVPLPPAHRHTPGHQHAPCEPRHPLHAPNRDDRSLARHQHGREIGAANVANVGHGQGAASQIRNLGVLYSEKKGQKRVKKVEKTVDCIKSKKDVS
jgi:hypothetical protein